jgi:hypothetical protein
VESYFLGCDVYSSKSSSIFMGSKSETCKIQAASRKLSKNFYLVILNHIPKILLFELSTVINPANGSDPKLDNKLKNLKSYYYSQDMY